MLLAGCELEEVVTASSEDVVIAEVYLRSDERIQTALLHRTRQGDSTRAVPGARVEVTNAAGAVIRYHAAPDSMCVILGRENRDVVIGSCYATDEAQRFDIVPGERYTLRITLAEGGELTGTTTVPSDFAMRRPTDPICALPANTRLELAWTASPAAWVYAAETNLRGLGRLLEEQQGIELDRDPVRLFGLSVSSADTSIVFPSEFGVFDRFDDELTAVLAAIQPGLPSGVVADIIVGAADRNYVNWERGGTFNPSGLVRIGNLRGAGAGVFGSMVSKSFQIRVGSTEHPPC
jgi:hypothetical protein